MTLREPMDHIFGEGWVRHRSAESMECFFFDRNTGEVKSLKVTVTAIHEPSGQVMPAYSYIFRDPKGVYEPWPFFMSEEAARGWVAGQAAIDI